MKHVYLGALSPMVLVTVSSLSSLPSMAQSTVGTASGTTGNTAITGTTSATGINSATTQSPSTTFQMQNASRSTPVVRSTPIQPLSQPSGLVQNHSAVIRPNTFGVPTSLTDFSRQGVTPNMLSTPNVVTPHQTNRAVMSPSNQTVPPYQKSKALQQLQPQLFHSP